MTVDPAQAPSRRAAVVRAVAELALLGLGLGLVMGLLWAVRAPDVVIKITRYGPLPTLPTEDRWFDADGWFAVLGFVVGLLVAAVAWWRQRNDPVALLLGVLVGSAVASLTAWWLGGVIGPADPGPLDGLATGTEVTLALGVSAMGVLLVPSVVAVATVVVAAALVTPEERPADPG